MRITKSQLKEIIKEVLNEADDRPDIRSRDKEERLASIKRAAKQFQADLETRRAAQDAKDKLRPHRYRVTADGETIGTYATKKGARHAIEMDKREIIGPTPRGIETKAQKELTYPKYEIVPLDLASDSDRPRPDEERYLRNAPRGGD